MSEINTPFADAQVPTPSKDSGVNVSLKGGDPGYKKQTSADIPEATSRHSNLDGSASPDLTSSQSPDAIVKRVG